MEWMGDTPSTVMTTYGAKRLRANLLAFMWHLHLITGYEGRRVFVLINVWWTKALRGELIAKMWKNTTFSRNEDSLDLIEEWIFTIVRWLHNLGIPGRLFLEAEKHYFQFFPISNMLTPLYRHPFCFIAAQEHTFMTFTMFGTFSLSGPYNACHTHSVDYSFIITLLLPSLWSLKHWLIWLLLF